MGTRARLLLRGCAGAAALGVLVWTAAHCGAVYVGGSSMRPVCMPGDLAIYSRGTRGLRARDVVLFARSDGSRALHRVCSVAADGALRTRGDANPTADQERVCRSDVQGIVVVIVPTGRAIEAMVAGVRWCYNHVPIANTRR